MSESVVPSPAVNPVQKKQFAGLLSGPGRARSLARFGLACAWYVAAVRLAAVTGWFTRGDFAEVLYRCLLVVLLLVGFSLMGMVLDGQDEPFKAMGLVRRETAAREFGVGAALGWGLVVLAVLPIALTGRLYIDFWHSPRIVFLFVLNLGVIAVASLAEELVFRGYPFQRLIEATGPATATATMAIFFGLEHIGNTDSSMTSVLVTMLAGVLLSVAYLRTKALWLPWGLHLAWNLSMGGFFGLPVSGNTDFATIVQTNAVGPRWLTGGAYGPEGALATFVVLIVGIVVLVRVTREYAWDYTHRPIVAAGYAMEVAPPKAHVEMESKAAPQLIQIAASTPQEASLHENWGREADSAAAQRNDKK
ncbi:MAG TPA: type II CAAX endopeptidase family protein [Acidobacteriaceae bacterium]